VAPHKPLAWQTEGVRGTADLDRPGVSKMPTAPATGTPKHAFAPLTPATPFSAVPRVVISPGHAPCSAANAAPIASETFAATDDPVNLSDPSGLGPRPPELSPAEKEAIQNKENGLPYNRQAYNSAQRKIQQAEKFGGTRNRQKRGQSNFDWNPLPTIGHALSSAGSAIWQAAQAIGHSVWGVVVTVGGAASALVAWLFDNVPVFAAMNGTAQTYSTGSNCG